MSALAEMTKIINDLEKRGINIVYIIELPEKKKSGTRIYEAHVSRHTKNA